MHNVFHRKMLKAVQIKLQTKQNQSAKDAAPKYRYLGCVFHSITLLPMWTSHCSRSPASLSKMIWKDEGKLTYWFPSTLRATSSALSIMFQMMECEIKLKDASVLSPLIASLVEVFKEHSEQGEKWEYKKAMWVH